MTPTTLAAWNAAQRRTRCEYERNPIISCATEGCGNTARDQMEWCLSCLVGMRLRRGA